MMFWLKACPRCRGDLQLIHDVGADYVSCIQCGRILTADQEQLLPRRFERAQQRRAPARAGEAAA